MLSHWRQQSVGSVASVRAEVDSEGSGGAISQLLLPVKTVMAVTPIPPVTPILGAVVFNLLLPQDKEALRPALEDR